MTVAELLQQLRQRSILVRAEGDKLKVLAPPGALTAELSDDIRLHKQEILRLLGETKAIVVQDRAQRNIARAANQERYPLSIAQRRAAAVNAATAMLPSAFRLSGQLDVPALHETLRRMVARHAPMRSRFRLDLPEPEQVVEAAIDVELPTTDLSQLPDAERDAALRELLTTQARTPLDLSAGRPFRYHLYRLSSTNHVIYAGFSPLIFDGWCFDIFWNELRHGYAAIRAGVPWPETGLPISYADHVADQSKRLAHEEPRLAAFWRSALGKELPAVPLPTDFPRPAVVSTRGEGIAFELPADTVRLLGELSRTRGMTPQMLMLGALFVWAARLGGQDDNVIATPVDSRLHSSTEGLIGPFANVILLRFRADTSRSFAQWLPDLRAFCLEAYQHQEYPLDRIDVEARRRPGERLSPTFQIEFSYQMVHGRGAAMGDLVLSQVELESGAAGSDITLWVKDWGPRISGAVEFRPELFGRETVVHWVDCYKVLLAGLLREPDRPMREIDLLGPEIETVRKARAAGSQDAAAGTENREVVDAHGLPLPLGIPGRLAGSDEPGLVRLRHDGSLERCATEAWRPPSTVVEVEPATAVESRVAQLFADLTGATEVGPEQSFFDLGGTSIKAVRLFRQIHEVFGVNLPLTTIVAANTPRRLAATIANGFGCRDGSLVELKPGRGDACLFLIHDAYGESLLYLDLARRMPEAVAVYGLEPVGKGSVPVIHSSIAEFGAHYTQEIRRRQPKGPYCIGGLCAGGVMAFEVARQLRQVGEQVALLVLLESGTPQAPKRRSALTWRAGRMLEVLRRSGARGPLNTLGAICAKVRSFSQFLSGRRKARAAGRRQIELLRRFRDGMPWPEHEPVPTMRDMWNAIEGSYRPEPIPDQPAVLYRASAGEGSDLPYREFLADPLFGWGLVLGPGLVAVDIPGGHFSSLRAPLVDVLAVDLRRRLAQVNMQPALDAAS